MKGRDKTKAIMIEKDKLENMERKGSERNERNTQGQSASFPSEKKVKIYSGVTTAVWLQILVTFMRKEAFLMNSGLREAALSRHYFSNSFIIK